jgi:hypothetical protein
MLGLWARSASPASSPAMATGEGSVRLGTARQAANCPQGTGTTDRGGGTQGYGALAARRFASGRRADRAALDSRIACAVRSHPDGEVFLSLFRHPHSTLTAATLLCDEIGDRRERYPSAEALAADAGMSPVAKESGRRKVATFRRACDKRLRDAMTTLAYYSSRLCTIPGPRTSISGPVGAAATTLTPFGCWAGRGCG